MATWQNADGIEVRFGEFHAEKRRNVNVLRKLNTDGPLEYYEMDVDLTKVATTVTSFPADLDNDGTNDGFTDADAYIPNGAVITRCMFISTETAAGGTNVDFGLYDKDGTAVDADGLFADLLTAEMAAGEVSYGDGNDVNASGVGVTREGIAKDSYVAFTPNGTFTAGKGRLVLEVLPGAADAVPA